MSFYEHLKALAIRFLPESVQHALQQRRYWYVVRSNLMESEPDLRVAIHLVRDGSAAIDVGANIGVYTCALAKGVGTGGMMISLEPIPSTYSILTNNIRRMKLQNVAALSVAASDAPGVSTMEVPRFPAGHSNIYQAHITNHPKASAQVFVPSIPLDAVLTIRPDISFVKCDVEGHELSCLLGSTTLLQTVRPAWLIEVSGDPDVATSQAASVFQIMTNAGYEAWIFQDNVLRGRRHGDYSVNYFFLRPEHIDRIRNVAEYLLTLGDNSIGSAGVTPLDTQ